MIDMEIEEVKDSVTESIKISKSFHVEFVGLSERLCMYSSRKEEILSNGQLKENLRHLFILLFRAIVF